MFPSSVPTQITPSFTSEGAIVRIVPRACFESFSSGRTRVRSSLTVSQLVPLSLVFSKNCVPRYRRCGSCGEKTIGMVQLNRYLLPNGTAAGETSRTCPVVFDNRTTLPPGPALYTTSGSSGSGIVYPLSPGPTGYQSRSVICPLFPRRSRVVRPEQPAFFLFRLHNYIHALSVVSRRNRNSRSPPVSFGKSVPH